MSLNKKLLWGGLGWVFGGPIGAILGYTYASMSNKNHQRLSGASNSTKHGDKKNKFHFNYILDENSLPYYDKKIIPNAHVIKKDHINWLGAIISKKTIKKINDLSFDAIVDLNQSHNQNLSFILKDLKIPIKVGFQAEFSNFLYSIIIESKSIGFVEDNYKTIEKILGLE